MGSGCSVDPVLLYVGICALCWRRTVEGVVVEELLLLQGHKLYVDCEPTNEFICTTESYRNPCAVQSAPPCIYSCYPRAHAKCAIPKVPSTPSNRTGTLLVHEINLGCD